MWQPFGKVCALDLRDLGGIQQRRRLARRRALPLDCRELENVDRRGRCRRSANRPSAKAMSATAAFQLLGGRLLALLDHRRGGQQDRLALGIQAARTAGAAADRDLVGIALADADLLAVDAELGGGQLA